jgi:hypothetical protein
MLPGQPQPAASARPTAATAAATSANGMSAGPRLLSVLVSAHSALAAAHGAPREAPSATVAALPASAVPADAVLGLACCWCWAGSALVPGATGQQHAACASGMG